MIHGSYISGEWSSNGNVLNFHVNNEDGDEYATFPSKMAYDSNYIYYVWNSSICRTDFNCDDTIILSDHLDPVESIYVYKDKVYCRDIFSFFSMNIDGSDKQYINIHHTNDNNYDGEDSIVYKGKILTLSDHYNGNNAPDSWKIEVVNTDGTLEKSIDIPESFTGDSALSISCAYDDYLYLDGEYSIRVNLKTSEVEEINGLGNIIEPINDKVIYFDENSLDVYMDNILQYDKSDATKIYEGVDIPYSDTSLDNQLLDSGNEYYHFIVSNDRFVVIGYTLPVDVYNQTANTPYLIDIVDLKDGSKNRISDNQENDDSVCSASLNMCIIGDYLYYLLDYVNNCHGARRIVNKVELN